MNFIVQAGFDLETDKEADFQPWLAENEPKIVAACPDGIDYLGTFAVIFGDSDDVGAYRTVWAMDGYAGLDAFADAVKAGGEFAELMDGLGSFGLGRQDGGLQSAELLRRVTDAAIWGLD